MSSSYSPLSSLTSGSSYFNGMSSFSSSLNNEISQEVQLASLPIQILQNDVTTLTNQSDELQTVSSDMSSVQSAISGISSAVTNMLTASVSIPSVATATVASGAIAGTYTLTVGSLGSYSDALSASGSPAVTNPSSQSISASSSFTLTVGSSPGVTITPAGGSLNALEEAINKANAGVQATVVNVGSNQAPNYRLSLQSDQLGDVNMQLTDGSGSSLMGTTTGGMPASYTINGQTVTSGSDNVTLAPGVTANLTGTTAAGQTATVTVAPNSYSIGTALEQFVNAYNSVMTELGKNIGQSGGALAGESIVYNLSGALQSLANYNTGAGGLSSMAALGLTFNDNTGTLSFSQSTFDTATSGQSDALAAFLGSPKGSGFLLTATNTMAGIEDPTSGILTQEAKTVQSSITSTNAQIAAQENQVTQLQQSLTEQMSSADAMIYSLQQQSSYFQQMFSAEQAAETAGMA